MRRVKTTVPLPIAKMRLEAYRDKHGTGPFRAHVLADVIWPGEHFIANQGAGAAATRVLKRLGCEWHHVGSCWGWRLMFPEVGKNCP